MRASRICASVLVGGLAGALILVSACREETPHAAVRAAPAPVAPEGSDTLAVTRAGAAGRVASIAARPAPGAAPAHFDARAPLRFRERAKQAGLVMPVIEPEEDQAHLLNQLGAGLAFLDADGDGWLDLYVAAQSNWERWRAGENPPDRLFRNRGDGTFGDVTEAAGLGGAHWAAGVAAADYDNDGDPDVFVATTRGPDVLYENLGDGRFRDVTAAAGVGAGDRFSIAAVFSDFDRDGWLDLYVMRYIRYDPEDLPVTEQRSGLSCRDDPVNCEPHSFSPEPDSLYRNVPGPDGSRRFEDVTHRAGAEANETCRGMGIVAADTDRDGDDDIFLACDPPPNVFLENRAAQGEGFRFVERTLETGLLGYPEDGAEANMGIALGDVDSDGWVDFYVTDTQETENSFYLNRGGDFVDVTARVGLGRTTVWDVSWGVTITDFDNDAALDIFFVNGGWYPNVDENPFWRKGFRQVPRWFRGDGRGRFREVAGVEMPLAFSGRAVATGDYDEDGDPDIAVTCEFGPPLLFENLDGQRRPSVVLTLRGTRSNRDAIGAVVRARSGDRRATRYAIPHRGYEASHDPRLFFGLGAAKRLDALEVVWPSGLVERFPSVAAGRYVLVEGTGRLRNVPPPLPPLTSERRD